MQPATGAMPLRAMALTTRLPNAFCSLSWLKWLRYPLPDRQIAAAFQIHPVMLSRFRAMARCAGAAALVPSKSGPKSPSKMTPKIEGRCRALRQQGLSYRAIAQRVSHRGVRISHVTVAGLFREPSLPPPPETLPWAQDPAPPEASLPAATAEAESPCSHECPPADADSSTTHITELAAGQCQQNRYAGAMILYAALARLGVWDVWARLGANAGPSRRFGWAQTVGSIVFCFALRFRSVEAGRTACGEDPAYSSENPLRRPCCPCAPRSRL